MNISPVTLLKLCHVKCDEKGTSELLWHCSVVVSYIVRCEWFSAQVWAGLTHVDVGHSHEPPRSTALLLQFTEELVSSLPCRGPIAYPVHPRLSLRVAGEYVVAGVSRLFLGEPQGAPLSLLSGGAVLGGVGGGWHLQTCCNWALSEKEDRQGN